MKKTKWIEVIALALALYMLCTACSPVKDTRKIVWQNAVITKRTIRLLPGYRDTTLHVGDTVRILRKIKS